MKERIFGVLQRIGRSFMLPIAILPAAGLLLGLGSSFTNSTMIQTYGLENILGSGTVLHEFLTVLMKAGNAVFNNLPLIFAIGVAIGMAKKEKEVAALAAAISYFVMNASINAMLEMSGQITADGIIASGVLNGTITSVVGIQTLQTGVFGGIIVGLGVAVLHNRFCMIELPAALSFFSGSRFIPIISTAVYVFVGILLFYIWPFAQQGIYALGQLVTETGYFGTFIFGIVKRALLPFGLHHVFYLPFWQTGVGGSMEVAGRVIEGGQNIFFAQLADPNTVHFSADACRYFSGEFIFMIFGLPGAALAMYQCARPERKKVVAGLMLSAALASMMTGITEPIEFSFLFVAPMLFVVQVVLAGAAYMIAHILNIAVGLTFSGGLLDFILFGVLQGNAKTDWIRVIPVGIIYFALYYFIFKTLITKFDLKTPGREDEEEIVFYEDDGLFDAEDPEIKGMEHTAMIAMGLGGKDNIYYLDCCATRLRCSLADIRKVNDRILRQTGSRGIVKNGNVVQIIYGPNVTVIKTNLEEFLSSNVSERKFRIVSDDSREEQVEEEIICMPARGEVIALGDTEDEVFSEGMLGEGFAIRPAEGKVYAPVNGRITAVFGTKHAVGMTSEKGAELLIHVGLGTVKLKGEPFYVEVEPGMKVKQGDLLLEFDMDMVADAGCLLTTPVVVGNSEEYDSITMENTGNMEIGASVLILSRITAQSDKEKEE